MYPEWQHKFTARKPYPDLGPGAYIEVEAGLHYLQGNSLPYFSVTSAIWERPGARDCVSWGCQHEKVLRYWPELAPVITLHLSDSQGQPMHNIANDWYWLAGYYGGADERYHGGNGTPRRTQQECLQIFADHVRVSLDEAKTLVDSWACSDDWSSSKRWFTRWMIEQKQRYQEEADAACKLLDELRSRG
jgi:hypothetical protein